MISRKIGLCFGLFLGLGVASLAHAAGEVIKVDGSSTVFPITEAVAEEFQNSGGGAKVMVGISGTGGGFKRFCRGETDISNASRPIKQKEIDACREGGVEYIEIPVAYDGLVVVVNTNNKWMDSLTTAELKKLWSPEAQTKVTRWNQIRSDFPDEEIRLYGAGTDSGTFDYFTEAINGAAGKSRGDYTASEDDNTLVEGVATEENALGYFGLAYYEANMDKLKLVGIDDGKSENGEGPIKPTLETVRDGTYQPLSRPLFIYVSVAAAKKPYIKKFIEFYLANAPELVTEVGYVPLQEDSYTAASERFQAGTKGSVFAKAGSQIGLKMSELLRGK